MVEYYTVYLFHRDCFHFYVYALYLDGRIYAVPLHEIDNERPFTIGRRQCVKYYLKKTKGEIPHNTAIKIYRTNFSYLA